MGAIRTRRGSRRTLTILAGLALVAGMLAVLAPAASGVVNTCRARNVTQDTPSSSKLQAVINAADRGDTISVKYVCVGNFTIGKWLTLVGRATPEVPRPVLHANGSGRPLLVEARVTLTNLKITGGDVADDGFGGGIRNQRGTLTLKDVVVRGNSAYGGGGIYNFYGTLTLNDSSSVRGNTAEDGGGIYNSNSGTLILNGSSSVSGNAAKFGGGGIYNFYGTLTLNGSSSVSRNTAFTGGGINHDGTLILNDSSSVRGNTADAGGGIFNDGTLTLNDSSSVRGNTAESGGGFFVQGTLTLSGSSSVSGNTASVDGGGIYNNVGTVTLKGSSSVSGNTASVDGGGIYNNDTLNACDGTGVDEWTGAISPNDPDDPPTVTPVTCA